MSNIRSKSIFVLIVSSLVAIACLAVGLSAPKLPNYGVFLINGDSYIELHEYFGQPDSKTIQTKLETTLSTPSFLVWYPNMELRYFMLVDPEHPGAGTEYKTTPRDANGQILQVTPRYPLAQGAYCFYQGDSSGDLESLPFWCFRVGAYDADALAFRSRLLPAIDSFTSINELDICRDTGTACKVDLQATRNGSRFIWSYEDGRRTEQVNVGTKLCMKLNDDPWNCNNQYDYSPFLEMVQVVKGQPSSGSLIERYNEYSLMKIGSSLQTRSGTQCRVFFVDYRDTSTDQSRAYHDELCFDLKTLQPVSWIYSRTRTSDKFEEWYSESKSIELNVPVKIELPTP